MKAVRPFEASGTVYRAIRCIIPEELNLQHTAVRSSRTIKYASATVGSCVFTPKVADLILNIFGLVIASPSFLLKLRSNIYNFLQAFLHTEL